jgi:hypothetical protein
MEAVQQAKSARLEYRQTGWVKAVNLVAVAGLLMVPLIFIRALHWPGSIQDLIGCVSMIVLIPIGDAYYLATVLRTRIVIDGTRISVRNAFKERIADLSEIRGVRRIVGRSVGTYICLKDGSDAIELPNNVLDLDDRFREWLKQFPDLGTQGPFGYNSQKRNS